MQKFVLIMQSDRYDEPYVYLFDSEEQAIDAYKEYLKEYYGEEWDDGIDWQVEYDADDLSWIVPVEENPYTEE